MARLTLQRDLALSPFGWIRQHKEFRPSKAFGYQLSARAAQRFAEQCRQPQTPDRFPSCWKLLTKRPSRPKLRC